MDRLADILLVAGTIVVFWTFGVVAQEAKPGAMHFSENGSQWNGGQVPSGWTDETHLWWKEAVTELSALSNAVDSGWTAVSDNDQEAVNDAMSVLENAARFFAETDPPALSPLAIQSQYAGTLCKFALTYAGDIAGEDEDVDLFTVGQLATMRNDCVGAIHDARMEAVRYTSTIAGVSPGN